MGLLSTMPTRQPVPPPKNKYHASGDFEKGVINALFRLGDLDEKNPIWMDGYKFGSSFRESTFAAKNESLQRNGLEPIGVISTCANQPTSPPPPRKQ
jgi:hypothetical protein